MFENRSRERPALHQCIRTSGRQVTEGITPDVIHYERLPDIVVSTAIVELPDIEWIQRRDDVNVAVTVQTEGIQRAIRDLIQGVTIGVGRLELEAAIKGVRGCQSDAVIVRVAGVLRLGNDSKSWVRNGGWQTAEGGARWTKSVQSRLGNLLIFPVIAHIFGAPGGIPAKALRPFRSHSS